MHGIFLTDVLVLKLDLLLVHKLMLGRKKLHAFVKTKEYIPLIRDLNKYK